MFEKLPKEALKPTLAAAIQGLRRCGSRSDTDLFITGCGAVGLLVAIAAKKYGARKLVLGCRGERDAKFIEELGLEAFTYDRDTPEELLRGTHSRGFDFAFETSGAALGYETLLKTVRRGAVVGVLCRMEEPYTFFVKTAVRSQIRFIGVHGFDALSEAEADRLLRDGDVRAAVGKFAE